MMKRKELFSCRFAAGSRTYFFDVKVAADGIKYLTISESRLKGSAHEHTRVMVFEENIEAFTDALRQATTFLTLEPKMQVKGEPKPETARNFDEIRQEHAQAYLKWTPEDDKNLEQQVEKGKSLNELAVIFQRQPGAIRARLSKLGLLPD